MLKHALIIVVILVPSILVHRSLAEAKDNAAPAGEITFAMPEYLGEFERVGDERDEGQHVREILQTNYVFIQDYVSPRGIPVQVSIVYAEKTRSSLHFPEVCLVGQGWEIRNQYSAPVGFAFTAKRLILFKGETQTAVLYWFKTGDKLTGSFFLNTWYWMLGQMTFQAPTSAMIKLSTPIVGRDEEGAFRLLEDFATRISPVIQEKLR